MKIAMRNAHLADFEGILLGNGLIQNPFPQTFVVKYLDKALLLGYADCKVP